MCSLAHGAGFADTRMRNEEDEHIRVHRPHAGFKPDLLLKRRSDGANRGPLTEDGRGMQACGLVDERFDPRVQLPFAVYGRRFRSNL